MITGSCEGLPDVSGLKRRCAWSTGVGCCSVRARMFFQEVTPGKYNPENDFVRGAGCKSWSCPHKLLRCRRYAATRSTFQSLADPQSTLQPNQHLRAWPNPCPLHRGKTRVRGRNSSARCSHVIGGLLALECGPSTAMLNSERRIASDCIISLASILLQLQHTTCYNYCQYDGRHAFSITDHSKDEKTGRTQRNTVRSCRSNTLCISTSQLSACSASSIFLDYPDRVSLHLDVSVLRLSVRVIG